MMCERQIDWNIRDIVYLNTLIRVRTTHKTRLGDGCDDDKTSPQKETHTRFTYPVSAAADDVVAEQ